MKVRFVIFAPALLLLISVSAFSQDKEWSRFTRYVDGSKYTFKVTAEELQNLPSWNPETEDVPLSARKAIEVAQRNLARFVPTPDKWTLDHIELTRMVKDKWIYEVYFDCLSEDCGRPDSDWSFMIYVKMDGSIVEPVIESYDGKGKVY
jgi:hypothetical protein